MSSVYIKRWAIKDLFGFQELVLEPKRVNIITGHNASGKTSLLQTLRLAFSGGFEEAWIRDYDKPDGPKEGSILAELTNGNRIEIQLGLPTEKRKKYLRSVKVLAQSGEEIEGGAQTYLKSLADGMSFDPARFLVCNDKERAEYVARFLKVDLAKKEIAEATQSDWWEQYWSDEASPFDIIAKVRGSASSPTGAYGRRTEVNKEHKRLTGASQTLRRGIPSLADDSRDWNAEESAAAKVLSDLMVESQKSKQQLADEASAAVDAAQERRKTRTSEQQAEYAKRLAELDKWHAAACAEINSEIAGDIATIADVEKKCLALWHEEWDPKIQAAALAHSNARKAKEEYDKATGAREVLAQYDADIQQLAGEEIRLTACIERLDALKRKKLDSSPIPGLELRDGQVLVDGRDFAKATNLARQIEIAISVLAQNPGILPLVILDNSEGLDSEMWAGLRTALESAEYQVFLARVSDDALQIESVGELTT